MNQEILGELREKFKERKVEIKEHNKKVLRVRELMQDEKVREYINLVNDKFNYEYINMNNVDVIGEIYRPYMAKMREQDRGNVYFYLGTYSFYYHYDVSDGCVDKKVNYDDPLADYRLYWNLEGGVPIRISIKESKKFEEDNIIICTYYHDAKDYYYIQKEYLANMVTVGEEKAKKRLLKKYKKL